MATFQSMWVPASGIANNDSIINNAASASPISMGKRTMFVITADQPFHIKFGTSAMSAAAVTALRLPANAAFTFDMGDENTHLSLFNDSGSTMTYWILILSKF